MTFQVVDIAAGRFDDVPHDLFATGQICVKCVQQKKSFGQDCFSIFFEFVQKRVVQNFCSDTLLS
jgi:hypothetical protein